MAVDTDLVRDRFDIVDVIGGYVDLKKAGKNHQCCCPFHDEKSPSFTVAQDKQFYHCFGCGAHGDVIDFVAEINRVDFIEAIKILDVGLLDNDIPISSFKKVIKSRFYLGQVMPEGIDNIIAGCINHNGVYFSGNKQVLPLASVSGEIICLALIEGKGFDIRFLNKQLIWGSFCALGNIEKPLVLVVDYWKALKLNNPDHCVICVFDAHNLFFVATELERIGSPFKILCNEREDFLQAEKLNIYSVFNKNMGNVVVTDKYLDGVEL